MNEEQEQPKVSFFTVIPSQVVYDKGLSWFDKILYGTILSLASKEGYCYASNEYLAKQFDVSTSSISKSITELNRRGFVKLDIKRMMTGSKRKIFVSVGVEMTHEETKDKHSENSPSATSKNVLVQTSKKVLVNNNIDYENNILLSFVTDKEWKEVLIEWIEYRKTIHKSIKNYERQYKVLVELAQGNIETARLIVKQSIDNEYQGLFPLRNQRQDKGNKARQSMIDNRNDFLDFMEGK